MKKTKGKTLACILLIFTFLLPLIGNTAMADPYKCCWDYISYDIYQECWGINPWSMVDEDLDTFAAESRHCITQYLDENELEYYPPYDDILKVEIAVWGFHVYDNEWLGITPVFNGLSEGPTHAIQLPDGHENVDFVYIDITDDLNSHVRWTWYDVENLDIIVTTGCMTEVFQLYVGAVKICVTFE